MTSPGRTPASRHHLILVREGDPEITGSVGCCCRVSRDDVRWSSWTGNRSEPAESITRFGELYRALRQAFGNRLEITVLDPRNVIAFVPLVVRDAVRYRVPLRAALRAVGATSFATGVLDGRLVYSGVAPAPAEVLRLVAERLGSPAPARTGD